MKWKPHWTWSLAVVPIILIVVSLRITSLAPNVPVYQGKTYYEGASELQKAPSRFQRQPSLAEDRKDLCWDSGDGD
jgi:hypothetical protein